MFKIQDGRPWFYQWDLNQKVIVNCDATQVHFCNGGDTSLVVEVVDGCADVPNILLQQSKPIKVYAWMVEGETREEYTLCKNVFEVLPRSRPANYVYVETEVLTFEKVLAEAEDAAERAENAAGKTSYIGENGNWFQWNAGQGVFVDTGVTATGPQGVPGPQGEPGEPGKPGKNGEDGYTPVRGEDYWTEEDKGEIVTETTEKVLQQVNGVSFHICGEGEVDDEGKPIIENPDPSTFYLVSSGGESPNLFIEWVWINGQWEQFGSATIDLTNYVQFTNFATKEIAGVVKVTGDNGIALDANKRLYMVAATEADLAAKNNRPRPVVPGNLDYAVKVGVTTNKITLTAAEQAAARAWLGADPRTMTQEEYEALEDKSGTIFIVEETLP